MPDLDQARSLISMARKDLKAIEILSTAEGADDEIVGYHAQQAVEKATKAWLCLLDVEYPWTHDLRALMASLEQAGAELPTNADTLIDLTDFAVQYRYEAMMVDESIDRKETLSAVRSFVDLVAARIP